MKHKILKNNLRFFLVCSVLCGLYCTEIRADDLDSIAKLGMEGAPLLAIDRVDRYISQHPDELQAQLLKGMLLSMANKKNEAIKIFSVLMAKHPEVPAAGNNLAVVYASQHEYDKSIKLLQSIIKQHPDYLNAQKNLGDVYTELATNAYSKVYEANAMDVQTKAKYEALKQFQAVSDKTASVPSKTSSVASDKGQNSTMSAGSGGNVTVTKSTQGSDAQLKAIAASAIQPTNPTLLAADKSMAAKTIAQKQAVENIAVKEDKQADSTQQIQVLNQLLKEWTNAWSSQDVQKYLSFYADTFKTPHGESLSAWRQWREERIKKPRQIQVEISEPVFSINQNHATVVLMQRYAADNKLDTDKKRLDFVQIAGKWLIERERVIKP